MSFGSFLRGITAQVNPFDNGQTYGTFNPPQKKKPDDQNQPTYNAPRPAPGQNTNNNGQAPLTVKRPDNLFASLNNDLRLPSTAPSNNTQVNQPQQPNQQPQQQHSSFWHSIGNGIKTVAQTGAGVVANVPEVGLAAVRAGTGIVQGAGNLPSLATHALTYVPRKLAGDDSSINRGLSTVNRGVDTATNAVVNRPFNYVNRGLDIAAKSYEDHVPMATGGAQVYKTEQIPLNALAALLTLGGSTAAEAGNASKVGQISRLINKPLTSNPDNLIARAGQAVNKGAPVAHAINAPIRTARAGIQAGLRQITNTRVLPTAGNELIDAGEAGNIATNAGNTTQIPVATGIDVNAPPSEPVNVPVTNNTPQRPLIHEVGGDASVPGTMPTPQEIASRNFTKQAPGRPDSNIEGVTPRPPVQPFKLSDVAVKGGQDDVVNQYAKFLKDMGEGNGTQLVPDGEGGYTRTSNNFRDGTNKGKRMTNQDWVDQARTDLESGRAEPGHQQAFNDAADPNVQSLVTGGEQQPAPVGRPIQVKDVKGIPVTDKTVVPTEPGTPGTVRATTQTSPVADKSEAVANAPTVAPPAPLPAETQAVLDNPKQFTKRQVASARNQLKLAKKMAKTAEDTVAATNRITSAKPVSDKGFVSTGEFKRGVRGNITETAHSAAEATQGAHDTANLSTQDVLNQAREEINQNGVVSPETTRNLKAIRDSGQFSRTSPEFKAINDEYNHSVSHHARALSMTDRTARTSATGDQLANRFTNKLLTFSEDTGKLTDSHIKQVTDAENAFTDARDAATAAGEQFKATGSQSDFETWKAAQQTAEKADRQAKITEYLVSKDVLKGNKNIEATKAIQDAEKNAGVYSMDSIDANMLSGTGTMVRNYVNTLFPRVENKLFGKVSSLVVRKLAPIGGSSRRGARIGAQVGKTAFKADMAARKEGGVGFIRRGVTAGNTVGERNIQATAYAKGFDHYKQLLKGDGYTGKELNNRAEFNVRTDPDGLVAQYERDALQANALSGLTHSKKIENVLADGVQKTLANAGFGRTGQQVGRFGAKAITRVGLGFPTVIARSLAEGFKRVTLGLPEIGWSTAKFVKTGDKEQFAGELAKAIQHAGSGGSLLAVGAALGKMGVISGAYPSDPAERERWTAEGRQPNSINIGGQWFQIPGYLGGFGLPLMLGATVGSGSVKDEATLKNAWDTILSTSPVDNVQSTLDILTGNSTAAKTKNAVTSLTRTLTPAGSLVAELAKLTDKTQNDTTTKDTLHNILDSIAAGIPGLNNKVNTIDKTDAYGNVLHNPNPVATVVGAQGSDQKQGAQDVQTEQNNADSTFDELKSYGITQNKNLMQLVDPKLAKQINDGQPLTPQDVAKVQKAVTKGVSATEDNNWRQNGDYTTDKAAMQAKLQMLNADPTSKPSEKQAYETQIKRDDVLQNNNIPYSDLKLYESTALSDWRSMGDSKSEAYDPDTYQKLWNIDQVMAKGGASYNSKDSTQQKFSAKQAGSGRGSRSGSSVTGDFGKLSAGAGAPKVQAYQSINQQAGNVPIISIQHPNIVHNISSSR